MFLMKRNEALVASDIQVRNKWFGNEDNKIKTWIEWLFLGGELLYGIVACLLRNFSKNFSFNER